MASETEFADGSALQVDNALVLRRDDHAVQLTAEFFPDSEKGSS